MILWKACLDFWELVRQKSKSHCKSVTQEMPSDLSQILMLNLLTSVSVPVRWERHYSTQCSTIDILAVGPTKSTSTIYIIPIKLLVISVIKENKKETFFRYSLDAVTIQFWNQLLETIIKASLSCSLIILHGYFPWSFIEFFCYKLLFLAGQSESNQVELKCLETNVL